MRQFRPKPLERQGACKGKPFLLHRVRLKRPIEVLLSRINISIYGPEARRQQQQQYQQMQMMSNGMPQMQVHGVHVPLLQELCTNCLPLESD